MLIAGLNVNIEMGIYRYIYYIYCLEGGEDEVELKSESVVAAGHKEGQGILHEREQADHLKN